ncbi:MAG TPA: carboxypeptidase regulatory-like domain-containing protein [Candidatus Acidoferrales bacterium]|nr:carboxypeptidase regulatory-like domain-containing protein [Candidatus Acidoferrales bacterium]
MKSLYRCAVVVTLLLSLLAITVTVDAQTASTTEGAIVGTVTDTSGAAVVGATVTLSGAAIMNTKTVTTDQSGTYRFPALAPGDYKITADASGFGTETRQGVHISLGFTATVNVEMAVGATTQTITVSSQTSTIDLQANNITTNLEDDQLKNLPGSRDLWAVLSQAPAVAETKMDVGGSDALTQQPYTVYGLGTGLGVSSVGGGGINRGEVEGMMVNEGSGGGGSEMFYTDYGAMQTVSVNAANNTAEMPQPGVLSQMFVKSGGNQYHGDVYFDYENAAMETNNIDGKQIAALTAGGVKPTAAVPLVDTDRLNLFRDFAADVGGYLKKDKLWWFFAYRYTTTEQNYPTLNETQQSTSPNYTTKISYSITPKQKLVGFYTHSNKLQPDYLNALVLSGGRQAGALESGATTWNSSYPVYVYDLQYTYTITPKLLFELKAGQYFSGWTRLGKSSLPRIEDTATNFVSGGLQNTESDRHRPQTRGAVSYVQTGWLGTHNFKFGSEYMRDTDLNPWNGLGLPNALEPTVPCPTAAVSVLGTTCQVVSTLNNGVPLNAYFYALGNYKAINGNSTIGIYGNDTWQINSRLTLNVGLRFDRQGIFSSDETGPNGLALQGKDFITFHNFGPRLGISYDLSGKGTSVLKLSFGHYFNYPAADYGSGLNPDAASGWYYEYKWSPTAAQLAGRSGDTAANYYQPGDTLGAFQNSQGGVATTSFPSNLKLANTYQASAYIEQQLGGFTLRSGFVWNSLRDIAGTVNANRPLQAFTVPKTLYFPDATDTATAASPTITVWDLAPGTPTTALNVYKNLPESSHFYNWEFTALKRSSTGRWTLMGSFNYTWNYVRNFTSGFGTTTSYTPNQLINTVGCADTAPCIENGQAEFYNWQGKINSTISLPWRFRTIPVFRLQSGAPFGRYFSTSGIKAPAGLEPTLTVNGSVLAEPFGTERTPTIPLFDIRVEKDVLIRERFLATGFFDIYNIFNNNADQAVTAASGSSFLAPSNITPPRIARVGFKFAF